MKRNIWKLKNLLICCFCLLLMLPCLAFGELELHFLDVGQGDAAVILCDGSVMMIDGGKPESSQMIYSYLTNTLGIDHIDVMIASHPHSDHVGGLSAALNACRTDVIYTPLYYYNDTVFLRFRDMAAERNMNFVMPLAGTSIAFGGANVSFLAPYKLYGDTNDNSILLRIDYGTTSFLFTGDAEIPEEQEVLSANPDALRADVLKVGHHGSSSSSSEVFLQAVHPKIALIGVGAGNTYGHPSSSVLKLLHDMDVELYRTDLHGTIILHSDGSTISVQTARAPESPESVYTLTWAAFLETEADAHSAAAYYVGNIKSMKFHTPDCEGAVKMSQKNQIRFETREEAIQAGYFPCGTCKP
ncbi:MAG: MBL fold metallo-hydrolase [Clostridia bacterium]|nr:MBL fold metallo-hydrolase [Clostridia bacterium]